MRRVLQQAIGVQYVSTSTERICCKVSGRLCKLMEVDPFGETRTTPWVMQLQSEAPNGKSSTFTAAETAAAVTAADAALTAMSKLVRLLPVDFLRCRPRRRFPSPSSPSPPPSSDPRSLPPPFFLPPAALPFSAGTPPSE